MPGWPSLGILVTCWKPASRNICIVSSHASVLSRDRRLPHPLLEALHRFVVAALDLRIDGGEIGLLSSNKGRQRHGRGGRGCVLKKSTAVDGHSSSRLVLRLQFWLLAFEVR